MIFAGFVEPQACGQQAASLTHSLAAPPTGIQTDASLGQSVVANGQYTVAGAPLDDWAGQNSGVVKVFDSTTGALLHVLVNPTPDSGDQFGYALAISGSRLVVGAHLDDTMALNAGMVYVYDLAGPTPTVPTFVLQHSEPAANDNFGFSVAISGSRVAVGCQLDDVGATNSGTVLLFDLDGATPTTPTLILANPSPALNDQFGYSVALSGSRLAVGTPLDDTGASNAGTVYLFDLAGATPIMPVLTLVNPNPVAQDQFGFALALTGEVLAVGLPFYDAAVNNVGRVYVYDFAGGYTAEASWILNNPAPIANDQFGYAVAVHGRKVVVGVPTDDEGAFDTGRAFVYDLEGGTPTLPMASLAKANLVAEDKLGFAVGIWGDMVVAGVPSDDVGTFNTGSVAVFDLTSATPNGPVRMLSHSSPSAQDAFGAAVSVSGSRLVVGAPRNNTGGPNAGIAYVYDLAGTDPTEPWLTLLHPEPGNGDEMGTTVAISGGLVAVGVSYADRDEVIDSGVVYVFDVNGPTPGVPVAVVPNPEPQPSDRFGNAVALSGSRLIVGARLDDALAVNAGSAYVYDLAGTTPTVPTHTLRNPTPAVGDSFGESVSLSGMLAVVGAVADNTGATNAGSVYVYDLAGADPTSPALTLNNPAPATNDAFGISVSIQGSRIVVGAHLDDALATDSGSAYVYELQSPTPHLPIVTLSNPNPAASDQFGLAVAIDGTRVLVGAPLDDQGGQNTGVAYLFDLESDTPAVPDLILTHSPRSIQDTFGGAVALAGERAVVGATGVDTVAWDKGAAYVFRATLALEAVDIAVEYPVGTELLSGISTVGFGAVVMGDAGVDRVITVRNAGVEALTDLAVEVTGVHAGEFVLMAGLPAALPPGESGSFTVRFTPGGGGPRSAVVNVVSNDPDESPFVIALAGGGVVPLPEIKIEQPVGQGLVSGQSLVGFGEVLAQEAWEDRTFVVRNEGLAELTGVAIQVTGVHAAEFSVVTPPAESVAAGGSTSFTVRFAPLGGGERVAMLKVASNDASKNPFDILLSGTGMVIPEMVVEQPLGAALINGIAEVSFGEALVNDEANDRVFRIRNLGTGDLAGITVTMSGPSAGDYHLIAVPAPVIPPGGSSLFTVRFEPQAGGARSALITIHSNDPVNGSFTIAAMGEGLVEPQLVLQQPAGTGLMHEESTVSFGSVKVGGEPAFLTFVLSNAGTADLTGIGLSLGGANAADYLVTSSPPTILAAGATATFTLRFLPLVPGESVAWLRIASNDPDHNPFEVELGGAGLPVPIVVVEHPAGSPLVAGEAEVDFGVVALGADPVERAFTVRNAGTGDLNLFSTEISGPDAAAFSVAVQPLSTLDPGGSTNFVIRFTPTLAGELAAVLTLTCNDEDRSPFVIHLAGQGVALPNLVVETVEGETLLPGTGAVGFGQADVEGLPIDRVVVLRNLGTAAVTELTASLDGVASGDFAIVSEVPTTLEAGGSQQLTLRFAPSQGGTRTALLRLSSNDPAMADYDLILSGEGVVTPVIQVSHPADQPLSNGTAALDFDSALVAKTTGERTLVIRNVGTGPLSGIAIGIVGGAAGDFSLLSPVANMLAPDEQQSITVRFAPTAAGLREAVLEVTSDAPVDGLFQIALTGTGVVAPELVIEQPADTPLNAGAASVAFGIAVLGDGEQRRSFVVRNVGTALLSSINLSLAGDHAADFEVVTSPPTALEPGQQAAFEVAFRPSAAGGREAVLAVMSNDAVNQPFLIQVTGSGLALPKLVVEQPVDNALVNQTALVEFGSVLVRDGWVDRSFTLRNQGTAGLSIEGVAITGLAAGDYHVLSMPEASLEAGASTTFLVRFAPNAGGDRNASLVLTSNDAAASPFVVGLNGFGAVVPDLVLEQPVGSPMTSGMSTNVSFGSAMLGAAPATRDFRIRNVGTGDLVITHLTFSGVHAADFGLASVLPPGLPAGESAVFTVRFSPGAAGGRVAAMRLFSNDPDSSPFELLVSGTGVAVPDIAVEAPLGQPLTSGLSSIDCGTMVLGGALVEREFTLRNVGTAALTGLAIEVGGVHAGDFTLDGFRDAPLAPAETFTFRVRFLALAEGLRSGTLRIFSNDPDENPFEIAVVGTGLALPKMQVALADGTVLVGGASAIDFGKVFVEAPPGEIQITLKNEGAAPLTDLTLAFEGDHPADFAVLGPTISSLSPGASTEVILHFEPTDSGPRTANLRIGSNDATANPFLVAVLGFGNTPLLEFQDWATEGYQLAGEQALPGAVPQGDGVPNLLKYAFNMAADSPDSAILTPGSGTSGLPHISQTTRRGGHYLRIEFVRRIGSGLIYAPKFSHDLSAQSWTAFTALPMISAINEEFERVIYEEYYDPNVTACRFGKVEVILP